MVKKKHIIDAEALAHFRDAMKEVKPLAKRQERIHPNQPNLGQRKSKLTEEDVRETPPPAVLDLPNLPPVTSEAYLNHKHVSISHKILRKLQQGQYNIEAILDLHGMIIEEARLAVASFIETCQLEHIKVALIIHGKGHANEPPRLKNKVNQWLRGLEAVLAFCSAAPKHGGQGAVYILLKSK